MTEVKKAKSNTSATAQQSASPPHAALPLFRAGLILWTERLLSVFWPFLSALAAGLALGLTGLLPELPGYAHAAVLAVIASAWSVVIPTLAVLAEIAVACSEVIPVFAVLAATMALPV